MLRTSASSWARLLWSSLLLAVTGGAACAASEDAPPSAGSVRLDGSVRDVAVKRAADSGAEVRDADNAPDAGNDAASDQQGRDAAPPEDAEAASPRADDADRASETTDAGCAPIDKLDLLLMIDNSNSMAGEQASLQNAFPALIEALTSGARFPGDPAPFPGVKDLHVGVVSSDMGIPGVELPTSCHADGGDDGRLLNVPHGDGCDVLYPLWLSFDAAASDSQGVAKLANDLRCISALGTGGCGFEQQLESPFKALWPKRLVDRAGNERPNPYGFLSIVEAGTHGRGDLPRAEGGNLGFLRPATDPNPSLVVVVVVTDEDDCSVKSTEHLRPNNQLPEGDPYRMQDINLRCILNKGFLYDVKTRYYDGFRMLRPGMEDRVMFAAIAGIPVDLVTPAALAKVDFDAQEPATRQAFYDGILADARMQEVIDPLTMPGTGQGNITASCLRSVPGESAPATAFPPRRLVELAKLFDQNSMVQSICQDDFSVPRQAIVEMIARKLEQPCGKP